MPGKVYNRAELIAARALWKAAGKRVVLTNGCYDLLHPGHIRLLEQSRSLGDVLILALNSDDSVRRLKGPTRPVMSERERAEVAAGLAAVDAITVGAFDHTTNTMANFSSRGPAMGVFNVKPDVAAPGVHIYSTVPKSGTAISDPSGYAYLDGTSMATPDRKSVV